MTRYIDTAVAPSTSIPAVTEVLHRRRAVGSRPAHRDDPYRVVVTIEGGGSRVAYPMGILAAFDELNLLPAVDAVVGVSAGAVVGALFVSGSAAETLPEWPDLMTGVCDFRRLARGRAPIDTQLILDRFENARPGILERMAASDVALHPVATCTETGQAVDLNPYITDSDTLGRAVRASATIPVLSGRPVELGGRTWVDGGVGENLGFRTSINAGATHVVALRCRHVGEVTKPPHWAEHAAVKRYFRRHSPSSLATWSARYHRGLDDDATLNMLTSDPAFPGPRVLEMRAPADAHRLTRLERDPELLRHAMYVGREAGYEAMSLETMPGHRGL